MEFLSEMSTSQLVIHYNDVNTPKWKRNEIEQIIIGIIEYFRSTEVHTQELITAVIPLAACHNSNIRRYVLGAFINPINESVLLDPQLVHGLAQAIRYAYAIQEPSKQSEKKPEGTDDLYQVMNVLFAKLAGLHSQEGDANKLQKLLEAIVAVLNAMIDQGVTGLPADVALTFSNQLKEIDNYDDPDLKFLVAYARQALARIPDDTSKLMKYFGCGIQITGSLITMARGAACLDPGTLLDGIMSLKENIVDTASKVQRDNKEAWYREYRLAEMYLHPDKSTLQQLITLLNDPKFKGHPNSQYGILKGLTPILFNSTPAIQRQTLCLIQKITIVEIGETKEKSKITSNKQIQFKALGVLTVAESKLNDKNEQNWLTNLKELLQPKEDNENQSKPKSKPNQIIKRFIPKTSTSKNKSEIIASNNVLQEQSNKEDKSALSKEIVPQTYQKVSPLGFRLEGLRQEMEQALHNPKLAEDLKWYVSPKGVSSSEELKKLTKANNSTSVFDLETRMMEFLSTPDSPLLLIQGPASTGKSLLGRRLQQKLWSQYQLDMPIPLFIPLGQLENPTARCIEQVLERLGWSADEIQSLKQKASKGKLKLVFILDGFNEVKDYKNLYQTNKLYEWKAKVIFTSRPLSGDYHDLFRTDAAAQKLQEIYIAPLQPEQILQYLEYSQAALILDMFILEQQRAQIKQQAQQIYQEFQQVPGLNKLITESPFMLKILIGIWDIVKKKQNNLRREGSSLPLITRTSIYKIFIDHHYDQAIKELYKRPHIKIPEGFLLRKSFQAFGEEFAVAMQIHGEKILPATASEYHKQKDLEQDPWLRFVGNEDDVTVTARSGVPLKFGESTVQFIDESIQQYYVACALFREITEKTLNERANVADFNQIRLDLDQEIMQFLQEMLQQEPERIEILFKMIEHSRKYPICARMAANAASLLCFMKIAFSGRKLNDVRIPQADLTGANLDHTDLSNADLTGVKLSNAWLRGTLLKGACLKDAWFGERPYLLHHASVSQVAYNKENNLLISASGHHLYLWDLIKSELKCSFGSHTDDITAVAVSPDGTLLVSGSKDRTIQLYDALSGELQRSINAHERGVTCVAVSPNGQIIASGSRDGTICLWDVKTGKCLLTLSKDKSKHKGWITQITFSPDRLTFATVSNLDNKVRVWNVQTGDLTCEYEQQTGGIYGVAFNADGSLLASSSMDKSICLWNTKTQALQRKIDNPNWMLSIAFSPDGKFVAAGSWDNILRVWNVETGVLHRTFTGHTMPVHSIVFDAEGKTISSASVDKTVRVWDVEETELQHTFAGHNNGVRSVAFSADGKTAASCGLDNTIRLWDTASGTLQHVFIGHTADVRAVAFSPDGNILVSVSNDKTVRLWNLKSRSLQLTMTGHEREIVNVIFSVDGRTVVSSGWDKTVRLWDAATGKELSKFIGEDALFGMAFSPDGKTLAVAGNDQTIRLLNAENDTLTLKKAIRGHKAAVKSVAFNSDGSLIISGSNDKTVKIWDAQSGELFKTFTSQPGGIIESVCFIADSNIVAAAAGNTIQMWRIANGKSFAFIEGYLGQINSLAWHSEKGLIAGSADHSVKCWRPVKQPDLTVVWQLSWSTHASLTVIDCQLDRALDLSLINTQLLEQRGAKGKPLLSAHDFPGWMPLQLAVANNDIKTVQNILNDEPELLQLQTAEGNTLLHIAAHYHADVKLVKWLLEQGAEYQAKNQYGNTPAEVARDNERNDLTVLPQFKLDESASLTNQEVIWDKKPGAVKLSQATASIVNNFSKNTAPENSPKNTISKEPHISLEWNKTSNYLDVTIKTERLRIESGTISYFLDSSYPSLFSNSTNMAKFGTGVAWDISAIKQRVDTWVKRASGNDPFASLAITKMDDDQFIGVVVLGYSSDVPGGAELIYVIDEQFWNQGYGKESVTAVVKNYAPELARLEYKVNKKEFTSVVATVRSDNVGSVKILEACGMKTDSAQAKEKYGDNRMSFFVSIAELRNQPSSGKMLDNKEAANVPADPNKVQKRP